MAATKIPKIHTAYDPPPKVRIDTGTESRVRQSEADSANINKIMERYIKTGVIPSDNRQQFFEDVSQVGDFREALARVQMAEDYFMQLPAKVRSRFDNDPAALLDFCSDPNNRDEMVELGLIEDVSGVPPAQPEPAPEPSTPDPPTPE